MKRGALIGFGGSLRWLVAVGCAAAAVPSAALAQPTDRPPEVSRHMAAVEQARAAVPARARTAAERELMQVDLDFADDARTRHVSEAFRARFAPDGILIGQEEPVALGRDAAYEVMRGSRAQWHWAPLGARVDGDLGATWGVAAIVYRRETGELASIQTRYVTVWERREGRWQMWLDTGNVGPAPELPSP